MDNAITVNVTEKDIESAALRCSVMSAYDSSTNPVAVALQRMFPSHRVWAGQDFIMIATPRTDQWTVEWQTRTPGAARVLLEYIDKGIDPIEIEFEIPAFPALREPEPGQ